MGTRRLGAFLAFSILIALPVAGAAARAGRPLPDQNLIHAPRSKVSPATMPQFWLTDASIFIHNAASLVSGIFKEERLGSPDSDLLGNQARTAARLLARAHGSLRALEANARASNPAAVAAIRAAIVELGAARRGLAEGAAQAGSRLRGRIFVAIQPILAHLRAAQKRLPRVARQYLDGDAALTFLPLDGMPAPSRDMAGKSPAPGK